MQGRKARATRRQARPQVTGRYVLYPLALRRLNQRLGATPDDLAAWVFMGPQHGGIAAYVNANELEPPPRFFFENHLGESYIAALMPCWFREDDVESFAPAERFITGKALIERWTGQPGIVAEAFIQAKIEESRLIDLHPTGGLARGASQEGLKDPPVEEGLFSLTDIHAVESEDFGSRPEHGGPTLPVGSPEWRSQNARAAAEARHNQSDGSRAKQERMREIWASGKYTSRDRCAEEECAALDIALSTARRALRNTPDPTRT